MSVVIRKTKEGYLSECSCPDEKVGKGRCNHVIEGADSSINSKFEFKKVSRGLYSVDIDIEVKDVKKAEKEISSILEKFGKIDKNLKTKILNEINS